MPQQLTSSVHDSGIGTFHDLTGGGGPMGPDKHPFFTSLLGQALGQPAERDVILTHHQGLSLP
jgi:hypothetical protein